MEKTGELVKKVSCISPYLDSAGNTKYTPILDWKFFLIPGRSFLAVRELNETVSDNLLGRIFNYYSAAITEITKLTTCYCILDGLAKRLF